MSLPDPAVVPPDPAAGLPDPAAGLPDPAAVLRDGMADPELSRELRFFSGKIKIALADRVSTLELQDGRYLGALAEAPDEDCKIVVRGSEEQWRNMLERYPKPFYQCLQTTAVRHGLHMSSTNETFAYLPALNRLLVLMREAHHRQGRD